MTIHTIDVDELKQFMFAGKAQFAAVKGSRAIHFRIHKIPSRGRSKFVYFVFIKRSWIKRKWEYAGHIKYIENGIWLSGNKTPELDPAFFWLNKVILHKKKPNATFHRHKICGKCGANLYDKKSITNGFDPICWKQVKYRYIKKRERKAKSNIHRKEVIHND